MRLMLKRGAPNELRPRCSQSGIGIDPNKVVSSLGGIGEMLIKHGPKVGSICGRAGFGGGMCT
eukprot:13518451-Heterocapsa_arctica.AAC.1